jgi:Tfp pilus assembly protein PilF
LGANRKPILVGLTLLLGVTLWAFWGSLKSPFHFDDNLFLQSTQVTEPGNFWFLLKPAQTRQLTYLTFYWNYRLGKTHPAGYHLVNLLLHLANVVALYLFAKLLVRRRPESFDPKVQRWLPVAAAGVFALHPVQAEAVNYVYQRSTLLAAFFTLLAIDSYLWSEVTHYRRGWLGISGVCFFLAVTAKESALALPLIWLAFLWTEAADFGTFRRFLSHWRWIVALLVLAVAGAAWPLYNLYLQGEGPPGPALTGNPLRYLLAQTQVLATYLRILLWPAGLSIDHDFQPAAPVSLYALLCLLLPACILVAGALVRRRNPTLAFLMLAFLIFLAPTSSIVPSSDLIFEHRLYLPMTAGAILIAWVIFQALSCLARTERRRLVYTLSCFCLLLGIYAESSQRRTYVWRDDVRLWEDAVTKAPRKARAHYNLGVAYLDRDRKKAREEFLRTVTLDPQHAEALYNLGWLAQTDGAYDAARRYYQAAIQADPDTWQAHQNLGNLDVLQGDSRAGMAEFQETIRLHADYWPAYLNLATLQLQRSEPRAAMETLSKLIGLRSDLLEARYLKAHALIQAGRFLEAEQELRFVAARDSGGTYRHRIAELRNRFPVLTTTPR